MTGKIRAGLIAAIAVQFLILVGIYIGAQIPLWTGEEIRLKTIPVDPRSLFRGNYARLEYEISRIPADEFQADTKLRKGERVYVFLTPGDEGLYQFAGAGLEKPETGVFLRGRIVSRDWWARNSRHEYRVKYGIEAFFAPKEKALGLESNLGDGGVAEVMVSASGRARLKNVIAGEAD